MSEDMMNLRSLVETSADADLLREMIGFAAGKLMALEVGTKTGAGYGQKSCLRLTQATARYPREHLQTPQLPFAHLDPLHSLRLSASYKKRTFLNGSNRTLLLGCYKQNHCT